MNKRVRAAAAILFGITVLLFATILFFGCAAQPPPPAPVVVQAAPTPAPISDPYAGMPTDEAEAIKHGQTPVLQHNGTTVYPYSPDLRYALNCQALHVTMIRLRDDETTDKDDVKVGDRDRWGTIIGAHTVLVFPLGSATPVTVPGAPIRIPADPHMVTNLAIHSTIHLANGQSASGDYIFDPVTEIKAPTTEKPFTEKIEFYYPELVKAQAAARDAAIKAGQQAP
jgi:hypothetical protein